MRNSYLMFIEQLKKGNITKPDSRVLERIGVQYHTRIEFAAMSVGAAVNLYTMVKEIPTTVTKTGIENKLSLLTNGPMNNFQPNILAGSDAHGSLFIIKLLRSSPDGFI